MNNNIKLEKVYIFDSEFSTQITMKKNNNYLDTVLDSKTSKSIHLRDAMVDAARRRRRRRWMQRRRDHRNTVDAVAIQGTICKQMTTHPPSLRQHLWIRCSLILHPQIKTQLLPNWNVLPLIFVARKQEKKPSNLRPRRNSEDGQPLWN